jgi:hypothetical protein
LFETTHVPLIMAENFLSLISTRGGVILAALVFLGASTVGGAEPEARPGIMPRAQFGVGAAADDPGPVPPWSEWVAKGDPGSKENQWAATDFDDSAWPEMKLPTPFETAGLPDFDGVVWFRRVVELPAGVETREATLSLGPVDDMDVTWVNGKRVGGFEVPGDHFTPRVYPIPVGGLRPGKNVLAVRVLDHGYGGGIIGKPEQMQLRSGAESVALAGAWRYQKGASVEELKVAGASGAGSGEARPVSWEGKFSLGEGDVMVFTGGTDFARQETTGAWETMLTLFAGHKAVSFRNMAWQGDTVYHQSRPVGFAPIPKELARVHATVVIACFGQMEAMDGVEKLPDFLKSYENLLNQYATQTRRVILVTPRPFESVPGKPLLPDVTKFNESVAAYAAAIRELGTKRGFLVVDVSGFSRVGGLTTDGVNLSDKGLAQVGWEITRQLTGETPVSESDLSAEGGFVSPQAEALRKVIVEKNRLWHHHWRPTNWAFAYGDRQNVPSSQDHRPGFPRWFPLELDSIIPLIIKQEEAIAQLVKEVQP